MKNVVTFLSLILLAFALFLWSGGPIEHLDHRAHIVPAPPSNEYFPSESNRRFLRLNLFSRLSLEDPPPPETIQSGATFERRTFFFRRINSSEAELVSPRAPRAFLVLWLLAAVGLGAAAITFLVRWGGGRKMLRWNRLAIFGLPVAMALSGFLAGSELLIDNATDGRVGIVLDGKHIGHLGPRSYASMRLCGDAHTIEVKYEGTAVEEASLSLACPFPESVFRAYGGQGTYVYNVLGVNEYLHESHSYSR